MDSLEERVEHLVDNHVEFCKMVERSSLTMREIGKIINISHATLSYFKNGDRKIKNEFVRNKIRHASYILIQLEEVIEKSKKIY